MIVYILFLANFYVISVYIILVRALSCNNDAQNDNAGLGGTGCIRVKRFKILL
jgi:hypothetical protein